MNLRQALTGEGLAERSKFIALAMQEQVMDRIQNGGDTEISFKQLDFPRVHGDKANPLYDTGSHLFSSITHGVDSDGPWVGSTFKGGRVHQFGTKGKGGTLPTIVPKRAKALFIPLSPRAARSERIPPSGPAAKGGKVQRKTATKQGGKIRMTKLEYGKDFLLLQKVDIHPRPFLRMSRMDLEEIGEIMATGERT